MRIDSIKLQGFKSFRGETILSFPGSITAVVGPNGTGKSNIADAFRWVMGEQSLKMLRGKDSTDVIFSGSGTHAKLGRAKVVVKFGVDGDGEGQRSFAAAQDDRKNAQSVDHPRPSDAKAMAGMQDGVETLEQLSEVEITRKIYQSGEAHYLINNSEVRLLDIQLFLAAENVGQKNYAVVGQGMIDEILRLNPCDRLDFFYEATGVKKYQIKLHKAQLKLDRSKDRLIQTKALVKEIAPHKKYLAAQAERYVRRKSIIDELSEKQTRYYRAALWEIEDAHESKKQDFVTLEGQQHKVDREVKELEAQLSSQKKSGDHKEHHQKLNSELKSLEYERGRIRSKINDLEQEKQMRLKDEGNFDMAYLHGRLADVKGLLDQVRNQLQDLRTLRDQTSIKKNSLESELKIIREKLNNFKEQEDLSPKIIIEQLQSLLELTSFPETKKRIKSMIVEIDDKSGTGQIVDLDAQLEEGRSELGELSVKVKVVAEKIGILKQQAKRYSEEIEDLELKVKSDQGKGGKWVKEFDVRKAQYEKQITELEDRQQMVRQQLGELEQQEEDRRKRMYDWQNRYQETASQEKHISELWQAVKIELARLEFKRDQIKEDMSEALEEGTVRLILERTEIEKVLDTEPVSKSDLKILKGEIRKLQKEAAMLGEVEDSVVAEYAEIKERFDFLTEQGDDLESAIKSLNKITARLDKRINKQFRDKFKRLNIQFGKYFKLLFDGGSAGISQIELGIDIVAQPPGKKIKHIMTLSGGERSLVAVALICAIISSNPPPFVILDEIDAALDEANANRLVEILKKLSKNTQLIIITHNRTTMEIADVLYGVTMGPDGVSRLVGVKLEDYE